MREAELLRLIAERSRGLHGRGPVVLGPGDDCAVVELQGATLLTVDQLVGGRHFDPASTPVDLIARKAVARSVSDIAAMAGAPVAALATGCLPRGFAGGDELFERMAHWSAHWGCPLVGGDIATGDGPLVLTVTLIGAPHAARGAVRRSGARAGDGVFVTGALGGSLASGRHLSFEPRVREARALADALGRGLHAMIDLSDGLGRDAGRIAEASGVRIELEAGQIPRHEGVAGWREAASEGEDYELLFTAPNGAVMPTAVRVTRVGRVVAGAGCVVRTQVGQIDARELGWDHAG
ncbi:MAG TPA: thiamine-monophosphate kinase [Phycisphaerales bacterium]|nr:thiamine-monophosphate kinase [Phycisphaerales bacterium]